MPAPIAPLIGFVLGVTFAWAASDELACRPSSVTGRPLLVISLFSLLVFGPIALFFVSLAPDWAYAYLIDSSKMPRVADLVLVLVNVASVPLGFAAAARRASLRELGAIVRIALIPIAIVAVFLALTLRRLGVHATYRQFHGDFGTHPIAGSALGYGLLWMLIVLLGATVWTAHCLRAWSRVKKKGATIGTSS